MELGRLANENRPKPRIFDRYGHRLDEVEFHPSYHQLMALAIDHEIPSFGWTHADTPGAHVVRMAKGYLYNQADQGSACPLTMTYACVPTLRHQQELAKAWLPKVLSRRYDPKPGPLADKSGVTVGMGMTEKQGGSDVRANSTRATPLERSGPGEAYALVGHKWFFSAPMCDAWLVLAYAGGGLSCFLMPKILPDGSRNAVHVQRLKDKLGDWSNASSEVELRGALGWLVGQEGRGVANILEMVALTRQDCMIGSAGLMRQAIVQALHHCRHRKAFGKRLIEQPLMANVLADLALESEAHLVLTARIAQAVDAQARDAAQRALGRIATAIGKYWVCKRAPAFVNEAQECLGGAGYVEESQMPRLYRQAPLNSIWEGSGNIQCLDVLRALGREPEALHALMAELERARGAHRLLDQELDALPGELADKETLEPRARRVVERLALTLSAALLAEGDSDVFSNYCETRLGDRFASFGVLRPGAPLAKLIERAFPG
jgi:putative acyl-CoA dehydrogenase